MLDLLTELNAGGLVVQSQIVHGIIRYSHTVKALTGQKQTTFDGSSDRQIVRIAESEGSTRIARQIFAFPGSRANRTQLQPMAYLPPINPQFDRASQMHIELRS